MFYNSEDEEPIVLVVAEPGLSLANLIIKHLEANSLKTSRVELNQDFFLNYKLLAKQKQRIYKIVFIYGFYSFAEPVYQKIFDFLDLISQEQLEKIPIILISSSSTALDILNDFNFKYQAHLENQNVFLKTFNNKFSERLVFFAQDMILEKEKLNYPLLLFFSAIKQGYLFNLQSKFYFQDELSFFELIKNYLIKPHKNANFLVKGSPIQSEKTIKKISYLYEQYFQKKITIIKLFSDEKKESLFKEFSIVNNVKVNIEDLIDQKVRNINDYNEEISSLAPSEKELNKALEMSKLQIVKKIESKSPVKRLDDDETSKTLNLLNQAHKEAIEPPRIKGFDSEFVGKIESLFSIQRKKEKKQRQQKNIIQGTEIIKKSKKRKILFWLGSSGFAVGFVFLSLFFIFNSSQKKLREELFFSVKNGGKNVEKIDKSIIYKFFNFQLDQYVKVFQEENLSEALDIRELNTSLLELYKSRENHNQIAFNLYRGTLDGGADVSSFYDDLLSSINQQMEGEKLFNSYLMSLNMELYHGEERTVWQESLNQSKAALKNSIQSKRFLTSFKDFILQPGRVNLLILIQDSSEIRSTGGFLTEAIVLGFDRGILIDKQILNINDVDSRVYGHREANQEIKDLLGENVFYFRDSNWQADFSKSSQEAEWFIEEVTGSKIDLTLALNSKTIIEILKSLDGVELNDKTKITASNYLDNQEKTASLDYKNVSDKKFTWQLINNLFEKITKLDKQQFISLSEILTENLNKRELILKANNQSLQQTIDVNSWSGKKIEVICPTEFKQENCLIDSFYQVESNIGVNKINPYIKETVEHNLGIGKEFIRHRRKIIFENFSRSDIWPLGIYHNYLRFYLNSQANLEKIELNGQQLDSSKIKTSDLSEGREIALTVDVLKQSRVELIITYLVPNTMKPPFSYVFFDQKQPGIFSKQTKYNIVFEEEFKPQLIAPTATYQDKIVSFENDNSDHFLFAISFDK